MNPNLNPFEYHPEGTGKQIGPTGPLTITKKGALVIFVLDESCSMSGAPLDNLNIAVNRFAGEMMKRDRSLANNVEMAVLAFDTHCRDVLDWTPLGAFKNGSVQLQPRGGTSIGPALDIAFKRLKEKENSMNLTSYSQFVSYVVLISDGFGGSVDPQAQKITELTRNGRFKFWMLGVEGYDVNTAKQLTAAGPSRLKTLDNGNNFDYSQFFNELIGGIITGGGEDDGPPSPPGWINIVGTLT